MPTVIGIDHIYLTVSDLSASERFYDIVMEVLEFQKNSFEIAGDPHVQYYNREFGIVIRPARSSQPHDPYMAGLHHLCFRVDSAEDVNTTHRLLQERGIDASKPQLYPQYAEDYVATFLTDPDGIRLEITNYRAERRERKENWDKMIP